MSPPRGASHAARATLSATGLALLALMPAAAQAQQAPQVTPRDLRPDVAPAAAVPPPVAPAAAVPEQAAGLFVQPARIVVTGGFPALTDATARLIAQLQGRRVSVAQFYELAEAIEERYRAAGYPLIRVTVPPQQINDGGSVQLLVLDGYIERVDVSAVEGPLRAVVAGYLAGLVGRRALTDAAIERALTLASRAPGATLRSTLQSGKASGATVLVIEGKRCLLTGLVGADDRLSDALGPWQTNVQVSVNQLFGLGELLYVNASSGAALGSAYRATARRRVAGVGMVLPLGRDGWSINPEYTVSSSSPRQQAFTPRTRSRFERATVRLIYPLVLTRLQELTITGSIEAISQIDTLPDFLYTLDHDRLRVARLGAAWSTTLTPQSRLSLNATLSQGSARFGARTEQDALDSGIALSRTQATPDFSKVETTVAFDAALSASLAVRSVLRVQKTLSGALPGAELFNVDGEDALSSFTSGTLADDSGATLRQELSLPLSGSLFAQRATASPYLFGAVGKGHNAIDGSAQRGLGHAFGVGVRAAVGVVGLSAEYGRRTLRKAGIHENQLFVKAQAQF